MRLIEQAAFPDFIQHRLPTNTLSSSKRIQRWGNFIAGFSIEFVEQCLDHLKANRDFPVVMDPFAGCGTTLVGAKNRGFRAIGYEPHPVFYSITRAKLAHYQPEVVPQIVEVLTKNDGHLQWSLQASQFLKKLFFDQDLHSISTAAHALKQTPPELQPLATTLFLKACESACRAKTDGIYKAPTSRKPHIPFPLALQAAASLISEDIDSEWYREHWANTPEGSVIPLSSEDMSTIGDESVAMCITSPPYLNNFDYSEMTRMQLYLLGWCRSWMDISQKIRNHLITNTTTALAGKKSVWYQAQTKRGITPSILPELERLIASLKLERKVRAGKKEYDYLVYPYYCQISSVLRNVFRTLKSSGAVHWVVADAALYGVHVETHVHTAQIMSDIGFRDVHVRCLRTRGHRWILSKRDGSQDGLGEYHIEARK